MEKKITASNKTNIGPKPITITFFKALSSQGKELYNMFRKAMAGYVLRRHPVKLIEQKDYSKLFDHAAHNGTNYLNGIYTIKPDSFLVCKYTKGANL